MYAPARYALPGFRPVGLAFHGHLWGFSLALFNTHARWRDQATVPALPDPEVMTIDFRASLVVVPINLGVCRQMKISGFRSRFDVQLQERNNDASTSNQLSQHTLGEDRPFACQIYLKAKCGRGDRYA
jgi:hypothetical protein